MSFETLYSWVKGLPIVDWHNHLDIAMLAEDGPLGSLYDVWVRSDPYKHRAMRICGEPERVITGDAPEGEKWAAWRRTLPKLVGNPLFAWSKLEMEALGLDGTENVSLADWTPSKLLAKFGVEYLSPCVGAEACIPSLEGAEPGAMRIVPSLRMNADDDVSDKTLERFRDAGCRIVDVSADDVALLNPIRLKTVAAFAASHGWTMLLHLGALRETSARLRAAAGPTGGFAGMRTPVDPTSVAAFLDALEREGHLPRTILLSLNPEAHAQLAVLSGSFTEAGVPGKVQLGPAWWWCDHEEGMRDVLEKNAAYGVLSAFVGMTTDSRSLLSFVRHDHFRRVLCRWVAEKVASGAFPSDASLLRPLLEGICCGNARTITAAA